MQTWQHPTPPDAEQRRGFALIGARYLAGAFTGRVCDVGVVFIDLTGSTTLAANSSP